MPKKRSQCEKPDAKTVPSNEEIVRDVNGITRQAMNSQPGLALRITPAMDDEVARNHPQRAAFIFALTNEHAALGDCELSINRKQRRRACTLALQKLQSVTEPAPTAAIATDDPVSWRVPVPITELCDMPPGTPEKFTRDNIKAYLGAIL